MCLQGRSGPQSSEVEFSLGLPRPVLAASASALESGHTNQTLALCLGHPKLECVFKSHTRHQLHHQTMHPILDKSRYNKVHVVQAFASIRTVPALGNEGKPSLQTWWQCGIQPVCQVIDFLVQFRVRGRIMMFRSVSP